MITPWPPAGIDWYYSDDWTAIACADCRDVLPHLPKVDLVLTDPPYGIRYRSGPLSCNSISSTGKRFTIPVYGDDLDFDPSPWISLADQVIFTGAQYFYDRLPSGGSLHVWDKRGQYKRLDQGDADIIWHSRPGASRTFYCFWRGICRDTEHTEQIVHPTQKPCELFAWLFELAGPSIMVLDPFMGSGTTLVAAKQLGRRAIGIEIEERYCEIAVERLRQEVFTFTDSPEPQEPEQTRLNI